MKFCQPHWDRLRASIDAAGMGHLGAQNGRALAENIVKEIEGRADLKDFDPLMAAHNEITRRFLKPLGAAGLYVFSGDYCVMCELVRMNPRPTGQEIDQNWIEGVTKDLYQFCSDKGLIDTKTNVV